MTYTPAQLATLTGLPDPTAADVRTDPARLFRLREAAERQLRHFRDDAPLRLKVAASEYAALADRLLETPDEA